jgi:hypothetical protein
MYACGNASLSKRNSIVGVSINGLDIVQSLSFTVDFSYFQYVAVSRFLYYKVVMFDVDIMLFWIKYCV